MKTGRPREFDEEAVIENVMQSFWEHGYGRSTFEQLVSDSGLSRSSIYAAFGNKEALFNVAAQRYLDNNVVRMCQSLENKTTSEHSIRAFVQRFKNPRQGETKDCLFRKLLLFNAGKTADPIETHKAKLYLKRIWQSLSKGLSFKVSAKSSTISEEERAAILVAVMCGCSVIARNGQNASLLKSAASGCEKLIEG